MSKYRALKDIVCTPSAKSAIIFARSTKHTLVIPLLSGAIKKEILRLPDDTEIILSQYTIRAAPTPQTRRRPERQPTLG